MPIREEVRYAIEVPREPAEQFEHCMDYLTSEPEEALEHFSKMQEKYPGRDIKITKFTKVEFEERISKSDLEEDVDSASG